MFGYFAKAPCVFGDPSSEAEVFGFSPRKIPAAVSALPAPVEKVATSTAQDRTGTVVGKRGDKLLVKLVQSGRTIEVAPTDIERVIG